MFRLSSAIWSPEGHLSKTKGQDLAADGLASSLVPLGHTMVLWNLQVDQSDVTDRRQRLEILQLDLFLRIMMQFAGVKKGQRKGNKGHLTRQNSFIHSKKSPARF